MTDTGTHLPRDAGLAGDLREAAAVRLTDAPAPAQIRRRGNRRRTASRAATVTAALALLGGTATAGVYAGQGALGGDGEVRPPAATAGPSPSARSRTDGTPDVPFRVDVDVTRHRLTVYSNDKVVRTMPITAGHPDTPTPEGRYTVQAKNPSFRGPFPPGSTRGYEVEYKWHIALDESTVFFTHAYWWNNGRVHGEYNVTGGAISTRPDDAKWLYHHLDVGDTVTIRASDS